MIGDPYEEADSQQRLDEAKLVTPAPAKKNRKIFVVAMVLAGVMLGLVIIANIAGLVTSKLTPNAHPTRKPTTMTKTQSDSFAQQQSGQATYMAGMDRERWQTLRIRFSAMRTRKPPVYQRKRRRRMTPSAAAIPAPASRKRSN
jgi:hypothetical protein